MFNEKPATTSLKPSGVYFIISRVDFRDWKIISGVSRTYSGARVDYTMNYLTVRVHFRHFGLLTFSKYSLSEWRSHLTNKGKITFTKENKLTSCLGKSHTVQTISWKNMTNENSVKQADQMEYKYILYILSIAFQNVARPAVSLDTPIRFLRVWYVQ